MVAQDNFRYGLLLSEELQTALMEEIVSEGSRVYVDGMSRN